MATPQQATRNYLSHERADGGGIPNHDTDVPLKGKHETECPKQRISNIACKLTSLKNVIEFFPL